RGCAANGRHEIVSSIFRADRNRYPSLHLSARRRIVVGRDLRARRGTAATGCGFCSHPLAVRCSSETRTAAPTRRETSPFPHATRPNELLTKYFRGARFPRSVDTDFSTQ